jgi:hypothetical protein
MWEGAALRLRAATFHGGRDHSKTNYPATGATTPAGRRMEMIVGVDDLLTSTAPADLFISTVPADLFICTDLQIPLISLYLQLQLISLYLHSSS